ncbi:hypothetical protein BC943DRAFT_325733 [Umbelopsis sp. AD052]|nr:hypothetical protein BC943DRAFT_325733 [Umbelopsis sp. AD052]
MKLINILTFISLFALLIACAHGLENPVHADKLTIEKDKLINNIKDVMHGGEELSQNIATDVQRDIDHFLNNVQDWRHITEASISQTLSSIRSTLEQHNIPPKRVKELLERVDGALLDFEADLTTAQQSHMGTASWSFPTESTIRANILNCVEKLRSLAYGHTASKTNTKPNANYIEYVKSNYFDPLATSLHSALPTGMNRQSIQETFQKTANDARLVAESKVKLGKSGAEAYIQQARQMFDTNVLGKKTTPLGQKDKAMAYCQHTWNWLKAKAVELRVRA